MLEIIHMTVNGKAQELAVDPRECLTDTLRQRLGLTSVKKGCEVGECGACTVLIDGKAVNSCCYLSVWADGHSILTVEGLRGPNGELSPLSRGRSCVYSTVTDLARLRGLSMSQPCISAT